MSRSDPCRPVLWLIGSIFGALLASGAYAQELVEQVPPEYDTGPVNQWITVEELEHSPFHPQRFVDTYQEPLERGEVLAVASDLVARFEDLDWKENEPEKSLILRQLQLFLEDLRTGLRAPGIEGPLDTEEEQDAFLRAFNDTGRGVETLRLDWAEVPGEAEPVPAYFTSRSEDPDDWLVLFRYDEEASETSAADLYSLTLSSERMRQWRLLEHSLTDLLTRQVRLVLDANRRFLELQVTRWENYLDRGYSQMPWETLVNGWALPPPAHGPPDRQWIVMHPSVGVEFSTGEIDETRVKETLGLELLGHLWYRGSELEDYYGLSALATLREDVDPGLGVLLHFKRNWSLGVTWHAVDEDPFLFLSFDVFQFARSRAPRYADAYASLRGQLAD